MTGVDGWPLLFAELARRGYSDADLAMLAQGNILRVMEGVERTAAQRVEVVETPAQHRGPLRLDGRRGGVGPREADDLVPRSEQLVDGRRPDPSARPGDEHSHLA